MTPKIKALAVMLACVLGIGLFVWLCFITEGVILGVAYTVFGVVIVGSILLDAYRHLVDKFEMRVNHKGEFNE